MDLRPTTKSQLRLDFETKKPRAIDRDFALGIISLTEAERTPEGNKRALGRVTGLIDHALGDRTYSELKKYLDENFPDSSEHFDDNWKILSLDDNNIERKLAKLRNDQEKLEALAHSLKSQANFAGTFKTIGRDFNAGFNMICEAMEFYSHNFSLFESLLKKDSSKPHLELSPSKHCSFFRDKLSAKVKKLERKETQRERVRFLFSPEEMKAAWGDPTKEYYRAGK